MEFAGCLYEKPTAVGGARDWRVDPNTGATYPFDLTVAELKNMKITGVPIKIEHTEKGFETGDEVGRVTDACVNSKTGYTACKFALHDTLPGRTIRRLIENNSLDSLSLGHLYDRTDNSVEAQEVSVCFKGARCGTRVYKELSEYEEHKSIAMDSTPQPAAVAAEDANGKGAEVEADDSNSLGLTELLTKCTDGMEESLATALFSKVADVCSQLGTSNKTGAQQQVAIAELTAVKASLEKEKETVTEMNSKKAKDCVSVMNALLAEYVGESSSSIPDSGDDASLLEVAHRVPVLASALHSRKMVSAGANNSDAIRAKAVSQIKDALFPPMPAVWQDNTAPAAGQAHQGNHGQHIHSIQASAQHTTQHAPPAKRSRLQGLTEGQQRALSEIGDYASNGDHPVTSEMFPPHFNGVPQWADMN